MEMKHFTRIPLLGFASEKHEIYYYNIITSFVPIADGTMMAD